MKDALPKIMSYFCKDVSKSFTDQMVEVLVDSEEFYERWNRVSGWFRRPEQSTVFYAVLNEVTDKVIVESVTQSVVQAWNRVLQLREEKTDGQLQSAGRTLGEMLIQEVEWKRLWMSLDKDTSVPQVFTFLSAKEKQLRDERTHMARGDVDYDILLELSKHASTA